MVSFLFVDLVGNMEAHLMLLGKEQYCCPLAFGFALDTHSVHQTFPDKMVAHLVNFHLVA